MRKLLCLALFTLFVFSACANNDSIQNDNAKAIVIQFFEEPDNRSFEVSYPVEIDGENYYKIAVNGILNNGQTYPMDVFAVNPNNENRFFFNKETAQYQRFYNMPAFSSKTSPDGRQRIESIGMDNDGPSGLHALKEMRIINMLTGDVMWSNTSYLSNKFIWSNDSRFVSAAYSGRQWAETAVVDTEDFSVIILPGIDDILEVFPNVTTQNLNAPMPSFEAVAWESSTVIIINFEWATNEDTVVMGEYEYDVANEIMSIRKIDEISRG